MIGFAKNDPLLRTFAGSGSLAVLDSDNRIAYDLRRIRMDIMFLQILLQCPIKRRFGVAVLQLQRETGYVEPSSVRPALEPAVPIAEMTVCRRYDDRLMRVRVVGVYIDKRLRNLLPVGPDILYRRGAGGAGNEGEGALDARQSRFDGTPHDAIPLLRQLRQSG